ncbi:uncharacterized protein [Neodiprion pinetum]|uniref:uncharacterized protein n=1 Tax=Neodiprion pinetum TaxID=441929 RepID=UPI00371226AF
MRPRIMSYGREKRDFVTHSSTVSSTFVFVPLLGSRTAALLTDPLTEGYIFSQRLTIEGPGRLSLESAGEIKYIRGVYRWLLEVVGGGWWRSEVNEEEDEEDEENKMDEEDEDLCSV